VRPLQDARFFWRDDRQAPGRDVRFVSVAV
jgi:hypothetical protein